MAAEDDDIAKLMREIDAMNAGTSASPTPSPGAQVPATQPSKEVESSDDGARGKWALMAAVGGLIAGGIIGGLLWFLPGISPWSTGVGAALGAAIVALISGPPNWMK